MNAKNYNGYDIGGVEANQNANEVRALFEGEGYCTLATAAICGAFQAECDMNPFQWESNRLQEAGSINPNVGYGFPQFTPATEYIGTANTLGDTEINANYAPNFLYQAGNPNDGLAQCYFIARHHIDTSDGWLLTYRDKWRGLLAGKISQSDIDAAMSMTLTNFKNGYDNNNGQYSIDALIAGFVCNYLRPANSSIQNRFTSSYLTYARWYKSYFEQSPTTFVPRLTADGIRYSKWWYSNGNIFYASGFGLDVNNGNCTCYAYGRWGEIRNAFANLPTGNAGTWYDNVQGFEKGSTPRLGAIACYNSRTYDPNHVGHVSVVEEINGTQIKTSNSGWGGPFFWVATVDESNGYCENWMTQGGRNYYCQGFIYLDTYVPPSPTPTPSPSGGSHHIKPYYYINFLRRK